MKGKITKITEYKSGKGAFIGIDNKKQDYMFFGTLDANVGEEVEFEEGKPTGKGNPTIKTIKPLAIESFTTPVLRAHDAPKADAREQYWINKEKHDLVKDAVITRLSCISSACQILTGSPTLPRTPEDRETIIVFAKRFEQYAKTGE